MGLVQNLARASALCNVFVQKTILERPEVLFNLTLKLMAKAGQPKLCRQARKVSLDCDPELLTRLPTSTLLPSWKKIRLKQRELKVT